MHICNPQNMLVCKQNHIRSNSTFMMSRALSTSLSATTIRCNINQPGRSQTGTGTRIILVSYRSTYREFLFVVHTDRTEVSICESGPTWLKFWLYATAVSCITPPLACMVNAFFSFSSSVTAFFCLSVMFSHALRRCALACTCVRAYHSMKYTRNIIVSIAVGIELC